LAPYGEIQEVLAQIWRDLLVLDRIGALDNFFELGGHSLLAIKVLSRVNRHFGLSLKVIDIYQNPTVRDLARRIESGRSVTSRVDLSDADLPADLVVQQRQPKKLGDVILLTGATGFVGRFLLVELLRGTATIVYCLVRGRSSQQASSKLRGVLNKWGLWRTEYQRRVVAVCGDLREPALGLSHVNYEMLSEQVDSIYHCATSMNHLETYSMAKPANVDGAKEIVALAARRQIKVVNYISTLGIFNLGEGSGERDETSAIEDEKHSSSRGYAASKWVGEKVFLNAMERGIPCNLFRLGLVWADTSKGRYDELQRCYRMIKSCLVSGVGIKNYTFETAPTPVDSAVRAIVLLAGKYISGGGRFHISSTDQMHEGIFERCNEILGTSLSLMSYFDWIGYMKNLHVSGSTMVAVPLIEYAFSLDEESFLEGQRRVRKDSKRISCERTIEELRAAGFTFPVLGDEMLRLCVESMLKYDSDLCFIRERNLA
jgi:thioester reductase-like protein